ncbi:MAG: hypothetical protein ACHQYQ_08965, partial [Bacteriovoracales bacterium]
DKGERKISSEELFSASNLKSQEMLLFPKAFKFNLKSIEDSIDYKALDKMNEEEKKNYFAKKVEYLKPIEFQISPLVTDLCVKLATQEGSKFESFNFLIGRSFNPSEKCMVIEVKRKLPKAFGKKVLEVRRDDLLKMNIYLGENLKPYGKKVFLAVQMGKERYREVDILNSDRDTMSSELDLIPIDIPNPLNFAVRGNIKDAQEKVLRIPADLFVVAAINKNTKFQPCPKGNQIDYQDLFGNSVKIDWCAGEKWPRTINTPRFFAIKK